MLGKCGEESELFWLNFFLFFVFSALDRLLQTGKFPFFIIFSLKFVFFQVFSIFELFSFFRYLADTMKSAYTFNSSFVCKVLHFHCESFELFLFQVQGFA